MKVNIFLAAVLAVIASAQYSSEEDSYVATVDRNKRQTASDFENAKPFGQGNPNYPEKGNNRGPPYASTFFAAYLEKGIRQEKRGEPDFDYLKDVPKQSAYSPIRYSTYWEQNAKQADYVTGPSHNSYK